MTTAVGPIPITLGGSVSGAKLTERAMQVSLHFSAWLGQRIDRKTTKEVLTNKKAAADAGRWTKNLVPPSALKAVQQAHTGARNTFDRLTLPWGDRVRILAATSFFQFQGAMRKERSLVEAAHAQFCKDYPKYLADAPAALGADFDPKDYPDTSLIHTKFGMRLDIEAVPDREDFRVALGAEVEEEIRQNIEQSVTSRLAEAQQDLWGRLLETLKHFAQTMDNEDQTFRNTTVTKLRDIALLAPNITLVADSKLEAICAQVLSTIDGLSPEDLRKNPNIRRDAAMQAAGTVQQIQEAMKGAFV